MARKRARAKKKIRPRRRKRGAKSRHAKVGGVGILIAGAGAFLLLRGGGGSATVALSPAMKPEPVKLGESIKIAANYRIIGSRRDGMTYDPVVAGSEGGALTFKVSRAGIFTRNFVRENGSLFAEIGA